MARRLTKEQKLALLAEYYRRHIFLLKPIAHAIRKAYPNVRT